MESSSAMVGAARVKADPLNAEMNEDTDISIRAIILILLSELLVVLISLISINGNQIINKQI